MKGMVYIIPNEDADKLKALFQALDESIQAVLKGDGRSMQEVSGLQDAIMDYLMEKETAGEFADAGASLNAISLKYGLVLRTDELESACELADPQMQKVFQKAIEQGKAVAIEVS